MILFKPEHVPLILSGKKTQTTRIWKRCRVNRGSMHKAKTQMLSKDCFAWLTIGGVWYTQLKSITDEGAKKEGYSSKEAFLKKFMEINGEVPLDTWVWVVEFKVDEYGMEEVS